MSTIKYLNNASNEIEYVDKTGLLVVKNPFDSEYDFISSRLSLQKENDAENAIARNQYEQAIKNAQVNVDAGHTNASLPVAPPHITTPDDWTVSPMVDTNWNPPLLAIKMPPAAPANPLGDNPFAHMSAAPVAAAATAPQVDTFTKVLSALAVVGPALPNVLQLLQALLTHHDATAQPAAPKSAARQPRPAVTLQSDSD